MQKRLSGAYQLKTAFSMREVKTYCIWSHPDCSAERNLCCHSCKSKTCILRCSDSIDDCKYVTSKESLIEKPLFPEAPKIEKPIIDKPDITKDMRDALKDLRDQHKWTIAYIAKISEIPAYVIQRCLADTSFNFKLKVSREIFDAFERFLKKSKEI